MKTYLTLFISLFLLTTITKAQNFTQSNTNFFPESLRYNLPVSSISQGTTNHFLPKYKPVADTTPYRRTYNTYGDLLNDDPRYNPKYPWYVPAYRVVAANVFTWAMDRYVFNADFSRTSPKTWHNNLKYGWEWDNDRFGVNFVGHPYSGNTYFNIARSNGYSFWQSLPYAVEGSLLWEYFGENTRPSYNDIINTPISGMFLGEILYRLSSNILDDRKRGKERVKREILAGILDPSRALNRLTQGKSFRVTDEEVYQKEPLNITLYGGIHKINANNKFGTGSTNEIFNIQLDYGNPFERRDRKPFDLFRLRTELSYGVGRKLLDNVTGYGILFGKNILEGRHGVLVGGFQNYDYWDNMIFELGSLGFGPGLIARTPIQQKSNLYSAIHIAVMPLAGNSTRYGPDTSQYRDYNFGGGLEGKLEETLNLSDFASIGFNAYYYWVHTYQGIPGNSLVGILKPRVSVRLYKNLSIGFEHHIYHNDRYLNGNPTLHLTRTEQKFFLQYFFEDPRRKGQYR